MSKTSTAVAKKNESNDNYDSSDDDSDDELDKPPAKKSKTVESKIVCFEAATLM